MADNDDGAFSAVLKAMQSVHDALDPLDSDSRRRVIEFVAGALSIDLTVEPVGATKQEGPTTPSAPEGAVAAQPEKSGVTDIRTLAAEKSPRSAMEMAAVVAYYLSELAPAHERKETVGTADLEKYFKQASYKLPGAIQHTLPNASKAGYFDSAGRGQYRLNAVGYNLVAHTMPTKSISSTEKRAAKTKSPVRSAGKKRTPSRRATSKKRRGTK